MKVVVAFAFVLAMVLVIVGFSVSEAVPVTKAEEMPGFSGWYVIEKPVEVIPGIYKYKIARGVHEPAIEAFSVGDVGFQGYTTQSDDKFPLPLLWAEIHPTGAVFAPAPAGRSVTVNFIKSKTR